MSELTLISGDLNHHHGCLVEWPYIKICTGSWAVENGLMSWLEAYKGKQWKIGKKKRHVDVSMGVDTKCEDLYIAC